MSTLRSPDLLVGVADVLGSDAEGGEIRCSIGDSRTGKGIAARAPVWCSFGFLSRPNAPSADGAAQVLYLVDGDDKRVIAARDNRFAERAGALDPGDSAIVCGGEARLLIKQERDAIVLYTATADGTSMLLDLSGTDKKCKIMVGKAWIELDAATGAITLGAAGGKTTLVLDESGASLCGGHFACNTAGGNFGVLTPTPLVPPIAPLNSVLSGPTALTGVPAPHWTVSPL